MQGRSTDWRGICCAIDEYSVPETRRDYVAKTLRKQMDKARVKLKMDGESNAAIELLIIDGIVY